MRTLQLLITTHYLQISWHEMNFKLSLVYILINEVGQWFHQLDHVTLSKKIFVFVNYTLFVYRIYPILMLTLQLYARKRTRVKKGEWESKLGNHERTYCLNVSKQPILVPKRNSIKTKTSEIFYCTWWFSVQSLICTIWLFNVCFHR